ncbi:hypothetical protein LALA110947_04650 [Lactococcus laudensis]
MKKKEILTLLNLLAVVVITFVPFYLIIEW